MGKKKLEQTNRENIVAETVNTDDTESSSPTKAQGGGSNANPSASDATSLTKVLQEIRDFRKDTKEQLSAIQLDIANVNQKIVQVQERVDNVEKRAQNLEQVLSMVIKVIQQQENMLLDHEGRSRRENLKIYNVPEGTEEPSMIDFVEKLSRDTLEIPASAQLDIERAHRALAPRPTGDRDDKPRSIVQVTPKEL